MPIAIDCPVCETPVRLFANGFVEPHGEREPCIFTRTARSEADNRPLIAEDREAEADANPPWLKCDVCQKILRSSPDGRSDAHLDRQLEWCEGGADPTLEQAERVARKRSPEAPPRSRPRAAAEQPEATMPPAPAPYDAYEVRDRPELSTSVRAWSGGLPGLGRR